MKELKVTYLFFLNSLQQQLSNIPVFLLFFVSKLIRYILFFSFLYFLVSGVSSVGDYSRDQMLLFYLLYNFVDTTAQLLFREVYRFRGQVATGALDQILAKPLNPLLRSLLGGPDFIDACILLLIIAVLVFFVATRFSPSLWQVLLSVLLLVNSLVIATAFNICILAVGILTLSIDHLIMVYRDLTLLVRIPADLYREPVRSVITFVLPIALMFTVPAKALMGILSWPWVLAAFIVGLISLYFSLRLWHFALRRYSSASS